MSEQPETITIKKQDLLEQRQAIKSLSAAVLSLTATMKATDDIRRKMYMIGLAQAQAEMAELAVKAANSVLDKNIKEHGA